MCEFQATNPYDRLPRLTRYLWLTCSNFCWGIGQVIGVGVIKSQLGNQSEWAYRLPWALQWMWLPFLITGVALAPESPWLLVRKGRMEDARKNLLRLTSLNRETDFDVDETLAVSQRLPSWPASQRSR
jgi:SP family general alpha glucoside:H+ symporter-like MFS transporter